MIGPENRYLFTQIYLLHQLVFFVMIIRLYSSQAVMFVEWNKQ